VLEDIDCIIKNREEIKSGVTFSGILNLLDGLSSMDCMLTFITTNHFLELDAAIKRPGRIDYILEFSYINREQIFKMLEIFYPEEKEDFEEIYKEIIKDKFLVIHMRKDTWPSRNLSEETWQSIVQLLIDNTEYKIVQVGSNHEISFNDDKRLVDLMGCLTIHELKELIDLSECFIGIDSGTLHIAACTDKPIISMFTSAHHRLREPLDRPNNAPFIPIVPNIECYGCQEHYTPPITGVICHKGNPFSPPCKDLFDINDIKNALIKLNLAH
jgi:ADP-heptose:LPS heptosyltransferase